MTARSAQGGVARPSASEPSGHRRALHTGMRGALSGAAVVATGIVAASCRDAQAPETLVTSITLSGAVDTLRAIGAVVSLTATARDVAGVQVSEVDLTWSSSDPNVVTVSDMGVVTATGNGDADVVVSGGGVTAAISVTVWQRIASARIEPDVGAIVLGETLQLQAVLRDSLAVDIGRPAAVAWTSSNSMVATVDPLGLISTHASGAVIVGLAAEGVTASRTLTVGTWVVLGEVVLIDGGPVDGLHVYVQGRGPPDSAAVEPDGRFVLQARHALDAPGSLWVRRPGNGPHNYHPSLRQTVDFTGNDTITVTLVPTEWTLTAGDFAGLTLPVSLEIAFQFPQVADGNHFGIWFRQAQRYQAVRLGVTPPDLPYPPSVFWPNDRFPLPLYFVHEGPEGATPVSAADSSAFWAAVDVFEQRLGLDVYRPATGSELPADPSLLAADSIRPYSVAVRRLDESVVGWAGGRASVFSACDLELDRRLNPAHMGPDRCAGPSRYDAVFGLVLITDRFFTNGFIVNHERTRPHDAGWTRVFPLRRLILPGPAAGRSPDGR